VIGLYTFERAFAEYFKLSRGAFYSNNAEIMPIFSAAAVSLASRMWVDGIDMNPATFFIALIGEPRTGKSSFLRHYFHLFRSTGVSSIPIGSPEAMLKSIDAIRHGYVWYDEVAHLAKLIDSYMGTLPTIFNKAYYLDELSQVRMDNKKSVVVDAESYFIHIYFAGAPSDWSMIEKKAVGGFVRRTLVLPVRGIIPFFAKDRIAVDEVRLRANLYARINTILKLLTYLRVTIYLPDFPALAEHLMKEQIDNEKKSMVEEYFYKVLAGRILANLITFDIEEDPRAWNVNELLARLRSIAKRYGLHIEVSNVSHPPIDVYIEVTEQLEDEDGEKADKKITDYMPPNFAIATYMALIGTIKPRVSAPDDLTMKNVERIQQWLESGGAVVVSRKEFAQKILHTRNPQYYRPVLDVLMDAGYIRIVDYAYKGRPAQYVVLDPKARICANCAHYRDPKECPLLEDVFDFKEAATKVPPWKAACEKFEEVEE